VLEGGREPPRGDVYIVKLTIKSSLTKYMKILVSIMSEPEVEILYTKTEKVKGDVDDSIIQRPPIM
jgi:hypothetical protein